MSERTWSRLNFAPSSYEHGDRGGSNGHMETHDLFGGLPSPGLNLDYGGQGAETVGLPVMTGLRRQGPITYHGDVGALIGWGEVVGGYRHRAMYYEKGHRYRG